MCLFADRVIVESTIAYVVLHGQALLCHPDSHQRSTLPVRTPTKVSAMAMAKAIAEAMNAAAMFSLRAAATMAGPTI